MATTTVSTVFDAVTDGSMVLRFMVDDTEKTRYCYSTNGDITMSARAVDHVNSFDAAITGMGLVKQWTQKVWSTHRAFLQLPAQQTKSHFRFTLQHNSGNGLIVCRWFLNSTKVVHVVLDPTTGTVTFKPRPEITIRWRDFLNLADCMTHAVQAMRDSMTITTFSPNDLEDV